MKFDHRLLVAIRAYEKEIKKTNCLSYNGEVPPKHRNFIRRIHRWSGKILGENK
jgi:hypothetical protein